MWSSSKSLNSLYHVPRKVLLLVYKPKERSRTTMLVRSRPLQKYICKAIKLETLEVVVNVFYEKYNNIKFI